jgi:hypothetical protein
VVCGACRCSRKAKIRQKSDKVCGFCQGCQNLRVKSCNNQAANCSWSRKQGSEPHRVAPVQGPVASGSEGHSQSISPNWRRSGLKGMQGRDASAPRHM